MMIATWWILTSVVVGFMREKITQGLRAISPSKKRKERDLEKRKKRAPDNHHWLQCKSLFNVADLVNGMWKVAPNFCFCFLAWVLCMFSRDVRVQIVIWFQTFLLFTKPHFQTFNALKIFWDISDYIDTCLPFSDSVWEIFPGPTTIQKVYQGIDGYPCWWGYNDWQVTGIVGGLAACYITLFRWGWNSLKTWGINS